MSSQQRKYDNELPDPEPQRVCKCCGHWRYELDFAAASHVCCECDGELTEKTLPQPNTVTGETNDNGSDKLPNSHKLLH